MYIHRFRRNTNSSPPQGVGLDSAAGCRGGGVSYAVSLSAVHLWLWLQQDKRERERERPPKVERKSR